MPQQAAALPKISSPEAKSSKPPAPKAKPPIPSNKPAWPSTSTKKLPAIPSSDLPATASEINKKITPQAPAIKAKPLHMTKAKNQPIQLDPQIDISNGVITDAIYADGKKIMISTLFKGEIWKEVQQQVKLPNGEVKLLPTPTQIARNNAVLQRESEQMHIATLNTLSRQYNPSASLTQFHAFLVARSSDALATPFRESFDLGSEYLTITDNEQVNVEIRTSTFATPDECPPVSRVSGNVTLANNAEPQSIEAFFMSLESIQKLGPLASKIQAVKNSFSSRLKAPLTLQDAKSIFSSIINLDSISPSRGRFTHRTSFAKEVQKFLEERGITFNFHIRFEMSPDLKVSCISSRDYIKQSRREFLDLVRQCNMHKISTFNNLVIKVMETQFQGHLDKPMLVGDYLEILSSIHWQNNPLRRKENFKY